MQTQTWNTKPDSEFYTLELPEINKQAAKEAYHLSKGILLSDGQIASFWRVFKIESFDGENWYPSPAKAYTHFIRWIRSKIVIPQALTTKEEPKINLTPLDEIREKYRKAPRSVTCEEWQIAMKYQNENIGFSQDQIKYNDSLCDFYNCGSDEWCKAVMMKIFDDELIR